MTDNFGPLRVAAFFTFAVLAAWLCAGIARGQAINAQAPIHISNRYDPTQPLFTEQQSSVSSQDIHDWLDTAGNKQTWIDVNGILHANSFNTQVFNVKNYGATGNALNRTDGAMTSGSAALASASSSFAAGDVGKYIVVFGAGAGAAPLVSTIVAATSSTTVQLASPASTTVSGARFVYGTADLNAVNAASTALNAAGGGILWFPPGGYILGNVSTYSNEIVQCAGPGSTILYSPALGNYSMFDFIGVSNVGMSGCQLDGQQVGSAGAGFNFAFRDVTNGWFQNNYTHDGGSDLGVDIDSPSAPSNHIFIEHNLIAYSHNAIIGTVQTGDGSSDVHFEHNTVLENLSGQLMFGGDGLQNSLIDGNSFFGTSAVSACIQIEATSTNVVNVGVHGNLCENVGGSQAGIFFTETGSNSISNVQSSGNTIVNCLRGESINNFNGSGSGTVKDISISNETIIGTTGAAAVYVWNRAGGTFQNISISDVQIDGCATGDGNGCVILSGVMTGVSLNGIQVLDVPSGAYGLYETGSPGTVNIGSFSSSGGAGVFNTTTNLLGNIIAAGTPSGACITGATYSNTSGAAGSSYYACAAAAWSDVK